MWKHRASRSIKRALRATGYELIRGEGLAALELQSALGAKAAMLGMMDEGELRRALDLLGSSASQLNQDLFVLHELGWKQGGYFVEFGATDGRTLNNTLLLEREFGWQGILAEPGRTWRKALERSGRQAKLDFDCVWSRSGEQLRFTEATWAELSTVRQFSGSDDHVRHRAADYTVTSISLNDLLERHGAPRAIDYLSIDTEGSEFEILQAVDFDCYSFRCITCEHNFTANRDQIHALLVAKGYERKFEAISQFDDWYVYRG